MDSISLESVSAGKFTQLLRTCLSTNWVSFVCTELVAYELESCVFKIWVNLSISVEHVIGTWIVYFQLLFVYYLSCSPRSHFQTKINGAFRLINSEKIMPTTLAGSESTAYASPIILKSLSASLCTSWEISFQTLPSSPTSLLANN